MCIVSGLISSESVLPQRFEFLEKVKSEKYSAIGVDHGVFFFCQRGSEPVINSMSVDVGMHRGTEDATYHGNRQAACPLGRKLEVILFDVLDTSAGCEGQYTKQAQRGLTWQWLPTRPQSWRHPGETIGLSILTSPKVNRTSCLRGGRRASGVPEALTRKPCQ